MPDQTCSSSQYSSTYLIYLWLASWSINWLILTGFNSTGKFNIYCKLRAKDTANAKDIIFQIDDIDGLYRTETMISLEESINDKKRLMHTIFKEF